MIEDDLLRKIFLFRDLTSDELALVEAISQEEQFKKGTTIFREGTTGDKFYFVISGAIKLCQQIPGMGEEALVVIKSGEHFGEMSLMDNTVRSASAIADEDSVLKTITKVDFDDLLFSYKEIAYKLLWVFCRTLSSRLRNTNKQLTDLFQ